MDNFSESELIAVSVLPMITGVISSLGSVTIIFSIFRSTVKLQVPYRRFIFGLSCYDLLVSSVYALSTVPMPKEKSTIPRLSFGNDRICTAQGSLFVIGYLGSIIYSFNLAMYYFCTLRLKMSKKDFKKYEIMFHSFGNFWPLLAVSVMLLDDSINPSWTHCTVAPNPVNCIKNDDIECVSGRNAYLYQWIFIADVQAVAYGGIIVTFISIVCMQWRQEVTNRSRFYHQQQQRNDNEDGRKSIVRKLSSIFRRSSIDEDIQTEDLTELEIWQRKRNIRMIQASEDRERQVKIQALLYIGGFFMGYIFFSIAAVDVMKAEKFSFALILLREIFYPLQGFINIFVYTYPHVSVLRKGDSNLSWFRAFFRTVKSGGDHDDMSNFRNIRRHSIGQQPTQTSLWRQVNACIRNALGNFTKKLMRYNSEQRNVSRKSPSVIMRRGDTMAPTPPREEKTVVKLGKNISCQLQIDGLDDIECPVIKNTVVVRRLSQQDNAQEDNLDAMKDLRYIEQNYT